MPNVGDDYVLKTSERGMPIMWFVGPLPLRTGLPDVSTGALELIFGPGTSRKLKSWAHDQDGVHWLGTRTGTFMHQDTTFTRYTHHLLLRNDGYRIRGLDDTERHPLMVPGVMYCLDTHSPHQVVADDRLSPEAGKPVYKLQIAVDRDEPLSPQEAWPLLARYLTRNPGDDADKVTVHSPRPKRRASA